MSPIPHIPDEGKKPTWDYSDMFPTNAAVPEVSASDDRLPIPRFIGGVVATSGISLALMSGPAYAAEPSRTESSVSRSNPEASSNAKQEVKSQIDVESHDVTKATQDKVTAPVIGSNDTKPKTFPVEAPKITNANNDSIKDSDENHSSGHVPYKRNTSGVTQAAAPREVTAPAIRTTDQNPTISVSRTEKNAPANTTVHTIPSAPSSGQSNSSPMPKAGESHQSSKGSENAVGKPVPNNGLPQSPAKNVSNNPKIIEPTNPSRPSAPPIFTAPAYPKPDIEAPKFVTKNEGNKFPDRPVIFTAPTAPVGLNQNSVPGLVLNKSPEVTRSSAPAVFTSPTFAAERAAAPAVEVSPPPPPTTQAPPPPPEAPPAPPPTVPEAPGPVPIEQRGFTAAGETLSHPLDNLRKTSSFGKRWGKQHKGVDFGAPRGTPVKAMEDGVVVEVGNDRRGYGKFVVIDHGDGVTTLAAHLDSTDVSVKQRVEKQQVIGGVGDTGHSTGNHLHQEVMINGVHKNPEPYILHGKPLPGTKAPEPEPAPIVEAAPEPEPAPVEAVAPPAPPDTEPQKQSGEPAKPQSSSGSTAVRMQPVNSGPPKIFYARPFTASQPAFKAADVSSIAKRPALFAPGTGGSNGSAAKFAASVVDAARSSFSPSISIAKPTAPPLNGKPAPKVTTPLPPVNPPTSAPAPSVPVQETVPPPPAPEPSPAPPEAEVHPEMSAPSAEPNITSLNEEAVPERYRAAIKKAATEHGWPAALLAAQLRQESNFNENAVSRAGAKGPSQFMPGTWKALGKDVDGDGNSPNDIEDAIDAQARYMRGLEDNAKKLIAEGKLSGDPTRAALTSYNWGTGKLKAFGRVPSPADAGKRYIYQGKSRKVSAEAAQYAEKILNWANGYGYTGR